MTKVVYNKSYGGFSLSEKAEKWLEDRGIFLRIKDGYFEEMNHIDRHNPILVECVETLGDEANGKFASLAITEVKDKYYIEEYDGKETVVTPDVVEKWWINV